MSKRAASYSSNSTGDEPSLKKSCTDDKHAVRCAVCLEGYDNRRSQYRTSCGHLFHFECLLMSAKAHRTRSEFSCPMCRSLCPEIENIASALDGQFVISPKQVTELFHTMNYVGADRSVPKTIRNYEFRERNGSVVVRGIINGPNDESVSFYTGALVHGKDGVVTARNGCKYHLVDPLRDGSGTAWPEESASASAMFSVTSEHA